MFKIVHLDIDDCASEPCHNSGTCIDGVGMFTCQCVTGYTGDQCETSEGVLGYVIMFLYFYIDFDECASHPCLNGGSCIDGIDGYTCLCIPSHTGDNCETGNILWFRAYD